MLKKTWSLLALAAIGTMVLANVDLRTNIRDVYYRGFCEEAGAITMSVNGNDFSDATTNTPVYIRVRLDKNAVLCETLVDDVSETTLGLHEPIFLAMRIEGGVTDTSINAAADTVSIVRWIAGEPELWLKVQTPSDEWIIPFAGQPASHPTSDISVAWTFGVTARSSFNKNNPLYTNLTYMKANLPANCLDWELITGIGTALDPQYFAVSTLLCTNLSNAYVLEAYPALNSDLQFDTISFLGNEVDDNQTLYVETANNFTDIVLGDQADVNFSGDVRIARGYDIECGWRWATKPVPGSAELCFTEGEINASDYGWRHFTAYFDLYLECDYGVNPGSYIRFVLPSGSNYYFSASSSTAVTVASVAAAQGTLPALTSPTTGPWEIIGTGSTSTNNGMSVTQRVDVGWPIDSVNPGVTNDSVRIRVSATVYRYADQPATDVTLSVTPYLTNHGNPYDTLDDYFDGYGVNADSGDDTITPTMIQQRKRCNPSAVELDTDDIVIGAFTECASEEVSIFFPYLPRLVDTDWYVGFGVVNQGSVDFADGELVAHFYEADGSYWYAALPALPVRAQHIFYLDDDMGSGPAMYQLFDDGSDPNPIMPTAGGTDVVFGDGRMSMFVVGMVAGTYFNQVSGVDIDGFALVGNSVTQESFGYLPRNYDNATTQNADLPVLRSKK